MLDINILDIVLVLLAILISRRIWTMQEAIERLKATVARSSRVSQGAITLLGGVAQMIREGAAAGTDLNQLADELDRQTDALSAALVENTAAGNEVLRDSGAGVEAGGEADQPGEGGGAGSGGGDTETGTGLGGSDSSGSAGAGGERLAGDPLPEAEEGAGERQAEGTGEAGEEVEDLSGGRDTSGTAAQDDAPGSAGIETDPEAARQRAEETGGRTSDRQD